MSSELYVAENELLWSRFKERITKTIVKDVSDFVFRHLLKRFKNGKTTLTIDERQRICPSDCKRFNRFKFDYCLDDNNDSCDCCEDDCPDCGEVDFERMELRVIVLFIKDEENTFYHSCSELLELRFEFEELRFNNIKEVSQLVKDKIEIYETFYGIEEKLCEKKSIGDENEDSHRESNCPVCLENGTKIWKKLPCNHIYCQDCILKCSEKKCPLCRAPFQNIGYAHTI